MAKAKIKNEFSIGVRTIKGKTSEYIVFKTKKNGGFKVFAQVIAKNAAIDIRNEFKDSNLTTDQMWNKIWANR